jgi:hypothetical protein
MYFSIDRDLFWTVRDLFDSETTEDVENDGIEQLPNAETTEDFEPPSVENVLSLTILPTNSEVGNLWDISINLHFHAATNLHFSCYAIS